MNSLIFRTAAPLVATVMMLFSIIILLRGHNDPGGGFIAGLIGASAVAMLGMARGVGSVRRLMRINPIVLAGAGIVLVTLSGLLPALVGAPFLTGLWLPLHLFGTPSIFDIGVYFVVLGTIAAVVLALEDRGEGS